MARLLVPEIDYSSDMVKYYEVTSSNINAKDIGINGIHENMSESVNFKSIYPKLKDFIGRDLKTEILINDVNNKSYLLDKIEDATQSMTLGILLESYREEHHLVYKNKWDYVVITGNYDNSKGLESVSDIEKKIFGLQQLNNKKILFIYVNNKLPVANGYMNSNTLVLGFRTNIELKCLFAEVFEPKFDEKQQELLRKSVNVSENNYFETDLYYQLRSKFSEYKGFLIDGRSNSGKSYLASALVRYAMEIDFIYAPIWITINNNELRSILNSKNEDRNIFTNNDYQNSTFLSKKETINIFSDGKKKLTEYLLKQIKVGLNIEKKYILVLDNLEFDFVDDILVALKDIIEITDCIKFTIITSWEKSNKPKLLDKLGIKTVSLSKIDEKDFRGIYNTIIENQFTSSLQKATDEENELLENLIFQFYGEEPGEIQSILSHLRRMSVAELIQLLQTSNTDPSTRYSVSTKLSLNSLGLFSQIVLFEFLGKFGCENKICRKSDFQFILNCIREHNLVSNDLLSLSAIEKAFKQITSFSLIQENALEEYSIKNEKLKHILFSCEDDEFISKLQKKSIDISQKGQTAIYYGWNNELKFLVNNNYNELNKWLFVACQYSKDIDVLKAILEKGADINNKDDDGWTAIHYIARYNSNPDFLDYIISNYENISYYDDEKTSILHFATANENIEMLEYILKNHLFSSINEVDNEGKCALHYALQNASSIEVLKLLEQYNCDKEIKDKSNRNGLFFAVLNENIEIIKYVVENKWYKSLSNLDNDGLNFFVYALRNNTNLEVIKYLSELNISPCIFDKSNVYSLTYVAVNDNTEILKYYLATWPVENIDMADVNGWTALHYTARHSTNENSLEILLANNADINRITEDGFSVFDLGVMNSNLSINNYLLDRINKDSYPIGEDLWSFAHYAFRNNPNLELLKKIKNGFVIESTKEGYSLLHLAALNENTDVLRYVLLHHVYEDINQVDNEGCTALHKAVQYSNNPESVYRLLQAGADPYLKTNDGSTLLGLAATEENYSIVEYLINKKLFSSIDETDNDGYTALHKAVCTNKGTNVIELLCKNGSDVFSETNEKETLLHVAIQNNLNTEVIEYLLRMKYFRDVNGCDSLGFTPLLSALRCSNLDIVKLLIKYGADYKVKAKEFEFTALICSADNSNLDVIEYVLENKLYEDINEVDYVGRNALYYCAYSNTNLEVFKLLIKKGCNIYGNKEDSVLHAAIENHNLELVKFIVTKYRKIGINDYDSSGFTPLLLAMKDSGNLEIIDFLIKNGADIKLKTADGVYDSVVHLAIQANQFDYVDYLLKNNLVEDINYINARGYSPLHTALLYNKDINIIDILLKYGADYSLPSKDNKTTLMLAAGNDEMSILEYALSNKLYSDIDEKDDEGQSALHIVARYGYNPKILETLVAAGADINVKNKMDATILHSAARNDDVNIIRFIVEVLDFEGIEAVDENGYTALHYAAVNDLYDVFKYLVQLGLDPNKESYDGESPIKLIPSENIKKYYELISQLC